MNENKLNLTLIEKHEAAFQLSSLDVVRRARETGTPVIVWENNQIVRLSPDEAENRLLSSQKEFRTESN